MIENDGCIFLGRYIEEKEKEKIGTLIPHGKNKKTKTNKNKKYIFRLKSQHVFEKK